MKKKAQTKTEYLIILGTIIIISLMVIGIIKYKTEGGLKMEEEKTTIDMDYVYEWLEQYEDADIKSIEIQLVTKATIDVDDDNDSGVSETEQHKLDLEVW